MARIWRDGQKLPCFVYRLVTTGTVEEKVYQRQLMKSDLADATMAQASARSLSHDQLRQLFELDTATASTTHDLVADGDKRIKWLPLDADSAPCSACPLALQGATSAGVVTAVNQELQAGQRQRVGLF